MVRIFLRTFLCPILHPIRCPLTHNKTFWPAHWSAKLDTHGPNKRELYRISLICFIEFSADFLSAFSVVFEFLFLNAFSIARTSHLQTLSFSRKGKLFIAVRPRSKSSKYTHALSMQNRKSGIGACKSNWYQQLSNFRAVLCLQAVLLCNYMF